MNQPLSKQLECTCIALQEGDANTADAPWNDHPAFKGVRIKHLLTSKDTEQRFSCHLVEVAPECALLSHVHDGQTELHMVLEGRGECEMCGRGVAYEPGRMAVIPQGSAHEVRADASGLRLLAQFTPPLL